MPQTNLHQWVKTEIDAVRAVRNEVALLPEALNQLTEAVRIISFEVARIRESLAMHTGVSTKLTNKSASAYLLAVLKAKRCVCDRSLNAQEITQHMRDLREEIKEDVLEYVKNLGRLEEFARVFGDLVDDSLPSRERRLRDIDLVLIEILRATPPARGA